MTMKVRVTNESAGSGYKARVTTLDIPPAGPAVPAKEDILLVGQSMEVYIHDSRYITVTEVKEGE